MADELLIIDDQDDGSATNQIANIDEDTQLQTLDKFFFSGALGGIMTKNIGKLFK